MHSTATLRWKEGAHVACFLWLGRVRFFACRCVSSFPTWSSSQSLRKSSSPELPGSARLLCAAPVSRRLRRRGGDSGASLAILLLRRPLKRAYSSVRAEGHAQPRSMEPDAAGGTFVAVACQPYA